MRPNRDERNSGSRLREGWAVPGHSDPGPPCHKLSWEQLKASADLLPRVDYETFRSDLDKYINCTFEGDEER